MISILETAFFAGFTCCGIAILRGVRFKALPTIYILSFLSTAVYSFFNAKNMVTIGTFLGMCVIVPVVRYLHNMGKRAYLFVIVPASYGFAPGAVLYRVCLGLFNRDFPLFTSNLIMTGRMLLGTVSAYYLITFIGDKITKTKVNNE